MTWLAGRLTVWDETVVVLGVYYWIMNSQTETWLVGRLTLSQGGEFVNITNIYEIKYSMNFNSLIQLKVSFKSLRGECFQVPID